jgi:SAM-dependent methyltransferase
MPSTPELVKQTAKSVMPPSLLRFGRRLQRFFYGYGWRMPPPLAPLPAGASRELALAHRAWQVAAGAEANQVHICYYSMEFEGFHLPGERPWESRWRLLQRFVSTPGARVLELGCNLGLLSTYALRSGAVDALGVDTDATLLEANRLLQQAYRVSYSTRRLDFDDAGAWEDELAAFSPTIVTALSVFHWVRDSQRFLRFLSRFPVLLFEGHDSDTVERARLQDAGFNDVTLVGRSERNRSVFLAKRA